MLINQLKKLSVMLFIIFAALAISAQTSATAVLLPDPDTLRLRTESFDHVWNTVNEKHYDPTFGGVNWNKIRDNYRPRALNAGTDAEFYAIMRKMLGELKLSHFGVYPKTIETAAAGNAGVGVEIKMLGGEPVIERVEANSPAAAAGIKPGFVLKKIGGVSIADILKPLLDSLEERKVSDGMRRIYCERQLEARMSGVAGTTASIQVLNAANLLQTFEPERKAFTGEMSQAVGSFPAQPVKFESRRLNGNIGYIAFNMWVIPQMPKIRAAIREFSDSKGIIFDLRGNPGGIGGMSSGVAGLLVDKQCSLGSMHTRENVLEFVVYPQKDPFAGKIVIITDHGSASTSEVFAGGLQELGRATVVGETSAGAVLPSIMETLPTGALFQYAISDYRTPSNILLEARGVIPDVSVSLTRQSLLAGRDTQLEAAVSNILK